MAAGDFSASVLLDAQAKVIDIWNSPNPTDAEFQYPTMTLKKLAESQTARHLDVQAGSTVIGARVSWLKSGVDSVTSNGSSAPSLTCTLSSGTQLESANTTYTDNVFIVSNVAVNDTDLKQKNQFKFEDVFARLMMKAMVDIRKKLNVRVINFLNANKQANIDSLVTDTNLGNGNWAVNADGATIEAPFLDFKNEDAIVEIDTILSNNDFNGAYMLVNGRHNFRLLADVAPFKNLNLDQRSILGTLESYNMAFDKRDLDQTLGGKNTFAVDANSYIIINRTWSESQIPVQFDENKLQFYVEDPAYMINDNGTMRPIRYEVVYQKKCVGRNVDTSLSMDHQLEVKFVGQLNAAPKGVLNQTGIMKFKGV